MFFKGDAITEKNGVLIVNEVHVRDRQYFGDRSIKRVIFSDKVQIIGKEAFKDCKNLSSVEFAHFEAHGHQFYCYPQIRLDAFANTSWAEKQGDWVRHNETLLFYNGEPKEKLIVPADIKEIRYLYYKGHEVDILRELEFEPGSKCVNIWGDAIDNCKKLERITFPDTSIGIGADAFSGCNALKEIIFQNKLPSIHPMMWDRSPSNFTPSVYIPSEAIDSKAGWNIPLDMIKRMDYWKMMLKSKPTECLANGTTFKVLIDYAVNECEELGELESRANEDEIYKVLMRFHYLNVMKKETPEYGCDNPKGVWYAFPKDHFYCHMAFCLFHNYVIKPAHRRKEKIALCLKDEKGLSAEEIEKIRIYVKKVGYPIEIYWRIGHIDGVVVDEAESIEEHLATLGEEAFDCEDDYPEELGDTYKELLSGKQYIVRSEWYDSIYTKLFDGGYEEDIPVIEHRHYLADL